MDVEFIKRAYCNITKDEKEALAKASEFVTNIHSFMKKCNCSQCLCNGDEFKNNYSYRDIDIEYIANALTHLQELRELSE